MNQNSNLSRIQDPQEAQALMRQKEERLTTALQETAARVIEAEGGYSFRQISTAFSQAHTSLLVTGLQAPLKDLPNAPDSDERLLQEEKP
jgi:hypothetical protein